MENHVKAQFENGSDTRQESYIGDNETLYLIKKILDNCLVISEIE